MPNFAHAFSALPYILKPAIHVYIHIFTDKKSICYYSVIHVVFDLSFYFTVDHRQAHFPIMPHSMKVHWLLSVTIATLRIHNNASNH